MRIIRSVFLLVGMLFVAASAVSLFAQTSGTGAITGTVTDASGAVIPGATVQATNADTGQSRTVTAGADGTYKFSLLPPGPYNVKFTANGFKVTEVPRLTVAVTETPVLDQKLDLGTQAEQVTVEANAEAIQTTNASLGTILGGNQVTALPLTTRNYTNILGLSAGVAAGVTNAGQLGKAGMDFSVNGAGATSNNLQIDGQNISNFNGNSSNVDQYNGYGTIPVPNPDALQEFKVQTASYDAGYGRGAGANVNTITKSGTNAFHGTVFEFFRNTVLNANDFFLNVAGRGKGVLNQNQYGGVIGGPIKKDKLFFFASYQGTNQKNGVASQGNGALVLPPIPSGDRSNTAVFQAAMGAAFCPANHPGSTLYNTLRGGVQIACDGSNINPVAMNLLQYKFPNGSYLMPASTNGGFQNTNISIPARYKENQELANADYFLSNKHTVALRFFDSYAPSVLPLRNATVPGFTNSVLFWETTALLKLTSVLTPSLVNEARVSMHRDVANFPGNDSGLSSHQFGITPLSPFLDFNTPGLMTTHNITGVYSMGANGSLFYLFGTTYAYQLADQISWTHGKHTIRTGFELEQIRWFRQFPGLGSGGLTIPTFADFLIGRPGCTPGDTACTATNPTTTDGIPNNGTAFSNIASASVASNLGPAGDPHKYRVWDFSTFVNDDIKVNQRLTVNLGLRYDYFGITQDLYGDQTNVWPSAILKVPVPGSTSATGTFAGWVVPARYNGQFLPGMTRASNNSTLESGPPKDNFAPRFGFAWQPFGGNTFVVRGGYGFFFDRVPGLAIILPSQNAPPSAPPASFSGVGGYFSTLAVPFRPTVPTGSFPTRWVNFASSTSSNLAQQIFDPNWKTPMTQSYNLGIQYNFLPNLVLEVGYVGSHGIHQKGGGVQGGNVNINSANLASAANPIWGVTTNTVSNAVLRVPYLGFAAMGDYCTCFDSKFNSLQISLRKQFSHGFQAQAAYTWASAFTNEITTQDLHNLGENYGLNSAYRPQRLVINYSWNLPFGNSRGFASKLVGGWSLSGVTTIQGGAPLTITDGRGGTIYGLATSRAQLAAGKTYADIATPGGVTSRLGGATGGCGYFTSSAVAGSLNGSTCASLSPFVIVPNAVAPDGTVTNGTGWGNTGIGVIRGPGQVNFDAALLKTTRVGGIREDATLQFRAEFFNMFNHAQFANPALVDSTSTFGQITSTTVNPRLIQLALKYIF